MSVTPEKQQEIDYQVGFDPKVYLDTYYGETYWPFNVEILNLLHKSMESRKETNFHFLLGIKNMDVSSLLQPHG